jgi:CRISPR-associated protein Cmr6
MSLNHLPLSRDTRAAFPAFAGKANNPGLIFDRYIAYWEDWTLEPKRRMDPPNPKFATLNQIANVPCDARLLAALSKRQEQLFRSCDAKTFEAHPDWRFITGLGGHSPLEVGFTFHRLYGVPIIAGSSLKGLSLAYAKYGLQIKDEELELIFGAQERAGAAIFFDALPVSAPKLELDVMNPHYPEWYQEGKAPANWQNPIPVFFLTVGKETVFRFAVGGRGKDGAPAKEKARAWLEEALCEMGAGAKTSAGYGYFSASETVAAAPSKAEPVTVAAEPQKTAPKHRDQPARGKAGRFATPSPEQEKAAAEAKKEADNFLRQLEKEKQAHAVQRQTAYQNNATEPKAKVELAADGAWFVVLPKLPEQRFKLKRKPDYSKAAAGAKIRVRVVVDGNGNIVRAEEL